MLLVSTTRIIPGRAVPSFLSGRYPAVKVRKKLYVTEALVEDCDRGPFLAAGIDAEGTPAYVAEGMYEGKEA